MRIRQLYFALAILAASCSEVAPDDCAQPIRLAAVTSSEGMVEAKSAVAASPYTLTSPNTTHPIDAAVWFSKTSGVYTGTGDADDLNVHTTISYTSGAYTFPSLVGDKQLKYPAGSETAYCVGFFPRTKNSADIWTVSDDGTKATSVNGLVDGETDILYAPQISGSGTTVFPPQAFNHILTWIKVRIRVSNSDAPITWGKLQKIEILTPDKAEITLGSGDVTFSKSGTDTTKLALYDNSTGLDLPTMSTQVGSVFIASMTGTAGSHARIHLLVTTEEWGGSDNSSGTPKDVYVDLLDNSQAYVSGSTAGKLYVVTLSFDSLKTINASATLSPWVEENRDITGSVTTNE